MKNFTLLILIFSFQLYSAEYLKLANETYRDGDYLTAISQYRQALVNDENPPISHFNLANCYFQLDSLPQAIVHYRFAVNEAPEFFRPYLNLGIIYFNMGEHAKAIAVLELAKTLETNVQLDFILGTSFMNIKRYDKAIPIFQSIVEEDTSKIDVFFYLYEMNYELRDYVEAARWLEMYPDIGNRSSDKYFLLADLAQEQENIDAALFYLNKVIALDNTEKWAYYRIVQLHNSLNHPLSAMVAAERALELFPNFTQLATIGGNIAFTERRYESAEFFYVNAYDGGSSNGVIGLTNLKKVYEQNGQIDDAERITALLNK